MSRPHSLWRAWEEVARRLAAAPRLALCADFDGTLAPIVRHPGRARLPAATRRALGRLRRLPRIVVGVVSGRSLRDLRRRVGLGGIHYVGTHGLEWAEPSGKVHRRANKRWQARIHKIGDELERLVGRLPGIYVEHKTVSVAVHFRNASAPVAGKARRLVRRWAKNSSPVRLLQGKKVLELLPPGEEDKGLAVRRLAARLGHPRLIYLGDDVTDESAFRRLKASDVGIHVGTNTASRARYRLRSPDEVRRLLERVAELLA